MTDWHDISTAPKDGTAIQARIPGHGSDNIIAWTNGLTDSSGEREAGGWLFVTDQEPPDSWTDGVCWELNEDGEPSVQPTEWKPIAAPAVRSEAKPQTQPNPDPEVTPEMIEAGYDILANCVEGYDDKFSLARRIYRAMKSKEPL